MLCFMFCVSFDFCAVFGFHKLSLYLLTEQRNSLGHFGSVVLIYEYTVLNGGFAVMSIVHVDMGFLGRRSVRNHFLGLVLLGICHVALH